MTEIYRTDLPHVMHEIIDGEAVVANLDTGSYYGIEGVGAEIWELLGGKGRGLASVSATIAARHPGDRAGIETAIATFVRTLREEGLIRVVDDADPDEGGIVAEAASTPFVDPVISKYTDMEALLLADPIHEVDDEGWPNLK